MFFFFFQAEDGIRDYKVTGVQTCALPIYRRGQPVRDLACLRQARPGRKRQPGKLERSLRRRGGLRLARELPCGHLRKIPSSRSEERRVGKDCSTRSEPQQ